MREQPEIVEELYWQAPIEAHQMPDFLNCLLRCRNAGEIGRRVAGQGAGQQECHNDDAGDAR